MDEDIRREPDGSPRINLSEQEEVRTWAERLGVSRDELRQAAIRVGTRIEDLERELRA